MTRVNVAQPPAKTTGTLSHLSKCTELSNWGSGVITEKARWHCPNSVDSPWYSLGCAQLLPSFVEFHRVLSFGDLLQVNGVYVLKKKTANRLKEHLIQQTLQNGPKP
jgi:hypothetical protein